MGRTLGFKGKIGCDNSFLLENRHKTSTDNPLMT